MPSDTLPVLTTIPEEEDTKGLFQREEPFVKEISTDTLRDSLQSLRESMSGIFEDTRTVGDYQLKEIQLQVEISASGGIQLVGSAKAGGKGAITLTFRPTDDGQS